VPTATPERNQEHSEEELKESAIKKKKNEDNSERRALNATATSTP
jgi:hypothetical protein